MFIDGSYSVLYIKYDGVFLPIGCLTSNSFSEETESLDSTTRDNNGWKTNRLTNQSYKISFEGIDIVDYTSTTLFTLHRLTKIKRDRQLVEWKIQGKDGNYEYGVGFITSLSNDSSVGELSSFSGEIVGYGSPYDYLEKIIKDYENRINADGGTIEALDCLRKSIEEIINEEKEPTLALIPSGYANGKLYSVLPSNGDGDFDVTRGSNATRINKDGLIETVTGNTPRLNYPLIDGVVSGCPSLLLEPQRTNLISYSEDFSNAAWTKLNSSIVSNSTISPDGTLNASKYTATNATNYLQEITPASNGSYVFSIFVKKIDLDIIKINLSDGVTGEVRAYFNLSNETIETTKSGGTITDFGADFEKYKNGWYKVNVYAQTNSGLYITTYLESESLLGSFYIWGAMLEQGSYPTSYIPTTTSSSTRLAETCNGAGNASTFNDSEGVLLAEISALVNDSNTKRISLSDGTSSNRISLYLSDETIGGIVVSGGSVTFSTSVSGYDATLNNKILFKYKENDFSIFVNGFEILTDTSGATPIGLNELRFDNGYSGNDFYGKTKQLQYFDSVLTDSELEQISSWTSFNEMAQAQLYKTY